ncbi:MAG: TIGR00730 family Rossman fold protein [Acidobacteriota bacterium]
MSAPSPSVRRLRRVAVFCGSSAGDTPAFTTAAERFGTLLARRSIGIVYGGARVGLMGTLADAALAAGGEVIGVIPRSLVQREVAHTGLSSLEIVASMHERKHRMYALADVLVALPGGIGTFEELFEALTWNQLGLHQRPCGLLDVEGYYRPLVEMLDRAVDRGFLGASSRASLLHDDDPERLVDALTDLRPQSLWQAENAASAR